MSAERPSGAMERVTPIRQLPLEFRVLGSFEVRRGTEALPLGGSRPRALLALLLINRDCGVSVDRIVDALWGERPPATARHMVEVYVSKLRKLVGAERLVRDTVGYALRLDGEELDAARFERLLAEGTEALVAGDPDLASARLAQALALWHGPAFSDFAFEAFAGTESARLEELRLLAEEERVDAELARGSSAELLGELEALVTREPLRERRRAQLLLALYRAGRQADALAAYREARRVLRDELGLEPGPELRELERAILAQEPALAHPGEPSGAKLDTGEERRLVAVAFVEVAGEERSDPEVARAPREQILGTAADTFARHGASLERLPDETLMAVFGLPSAHEDDALRAAAAAQEAHRSVAAVSAVSELQLCIGIEAGQVITGSARHVSGPTVRGAARLREAAGPGETVVGAEMRRHLGTAAELEAVPARGPAPRAWRLCNIKPLASRSVGEAPFVGRQRELALLRETFADAAREQRAILATLLGEPGVGKSRLAQELAVALAGEARIIAGRCPPYGDGITYWPLRELIRSSGDRDERRTLDVVLADEPDRDAIVERLMGALGEETASFPIDEIRWAARRFLEALARDRPLLVVIEDVHWAEQTFLDLVEHVVARSSDAAMFVVCLARPELREEQPRFGGEAAISCELPLLDDVESAELVRKLAPGTVLTRDECEEIVTRAGGNPLFLEHLVLFASEAREPLQPPATIEALLEARLGRLSAGERAVAQCAAVVGRDFVAAAVAELLSPHARRSLPRHLDALDRRALISREPSPLPFEPAYSFRHVLIQEAAYRSLLKGRRADLHERAARFIERQPAFTTRDVDELVGYHLEQATGYLHELGTGDGRDQDLATQAAERLVRAGLRAFDRADMPAAAGLLRRGAALFAPRTHERIEVLVQLGDALRLGGDLAGEEAVVAEARAEADALGDPRLEIVLELKSVAARFFSDPEGTNEELAAVCGRAIPLLEELGDDRGLAFAWRALCSIEHTASRWADVDRLAERALSHARRCDDRVAVGACLEYLAFAVAHGPTPVPDGLRRLSEIRREALDDRRLDAMAATLAGYLEAMAGRFDAARDLVSTAQETFEERSQLFGNAWLAAYVGAIEFLADDSAAAERGFRRAYEILESMAEKANRAEVAGALAEVLCALGRFDEAEPFTRIGEQFAASDDAVAQVRWRVARARVLAHRGDTDDAVHVARAAVRLAERTDDIVLQAETRMRLAAVVPCEDIRTTTALLHTAVDLYEGKGHVVGTRKARTALAQLGDADPASG